MTEKIGEVLLYLVRHANVAKDAAGKIRGLENDDLDETGQAQALELRDYFEGTPLSGIYCDDLERTYQSVLPLAEAKGIAITKDIALRSWDVGSDLEGKSIEAHEAEIAELKQQKWQIPVGGQSWGSYEDQILTAFDRYSNLAIAMPHPILLAMHGSGISLIAITLGAAEPAAEYEHTFLEPAGIAAIYLTRSDGLEMRALRGAKESLDE